MTMRRFEQVKLSAIQHRPLQVLPHVGAIQPLCIGTVRQIDDEALAGATAVPVKGPFGKTDDVPVRSQQLRKTTHPARKRACESRTRLGAVSMVS